MAAVNRILTATSPPSPEPGAVLLETDRLIIRRFKAEDAPALTEACNHREIWFSMTDRFHSPYTLQHAEDFISDKAKAFASQPPEYPKNAAILVKSAIGGDEKPILIGSLSVQAGEDINYRMWDVGYVLTPSAWGKGYGTEAISALVAWLMENWPGTTRIQASTYETNDKSGRVLVKCGFVKEGLRRDSAEKNGVVLGEITYGLTRSDYENNKKIKS